MRTLVPGTHLVISTASVAELKGRLELADNDEIVLTTESGHQSRIRRSEIQTLGRLTTDAVWNGILTGAALGFAGGGAVGAAWVHGSGRYGAKPPGYTKEFTTAVGVFGSIAGTLVGWRMDARRQRSQVVYEADRAATSAREYASWQKPSRDSLLNGAVVGAALGAAAGTAFTHAVRDSDLGVSQYARGAIIFASIGAAAGLGIDTFFDPDATNRTSRRITLTPLVSRTITAAGVHLQW